MALGVVLIVLVGPFFILDFQDNVLFDWFGARGLQASLYAATEFAGFGIQGAAIATILSRGLGAVIVMGLLLSGVVGIRPDPSDFITHLAPGDGRSATVPRTSRSRGAMIEHPLSMATDGSSSSRHPSG